MNTLVKYLCLSGFGRLRRFEDRIWLSVGFIHFSVNRQMEVDRIQFGFWGA